MTKLGLSQEYKVGSTLEKSINATQHINRLEKPHDLTGTRKSIGQNSTSIHDKNCKQIKN